MRDSDNGDASESGSESLDSLLRDLADAPALSVEDPRGGHETSVTHATGEPGEPARQRSQIGRRFEIVRQLGEGGFGSVYLARDLELGRHVAIKVLDIQRRRPSPEDLRLFDRETKATARLQHPNIVTIHDWGAWEGRPYLVLEHLRGEPLSARIRRGRLLFDEALPIAEQVIRALGHAHTAGVVHLDLKPHNVFCCDDGTVKVLDFGLAQLDLGRRSLISALQATPEQLEDALGSPLTGGTPAYMAPEQWRQEPLDERTDLWALGVVLFEMLAGQLPYPPSQARDHVISAEPVRSLRVIEPSVPEAVARVVARLLAKDPAARFQTTRELEEALRSAAGTLGEEHPEAEQPYRYLEPFTEDDAAWFFGREPEVQRLRGMLENRALVALVGPSGAGKTSLVRAGLVPLLIRRDPSLKVIVVRPGAQPLRLLQRRIAELRGEAEGPLGGPSALGHALRAHARERGGGVVLFVDQLEELYGQARDREEQRQFESALLLAGDDADGPVRVIVALRVDFLAHLAPHPAFRDQVASNMLLIGPPAPEAMRAAVEEPARKRGFALEEGLGAEMVHALRDEVAPLPLLQLAASRLWEHRDTERRLLLRSSLEELGGVSGVLAAHAEEVMRQVQGPDAELLVRQILVRMVTPAGTRQAQDRDELVGSLDSPDVAKRLLEVLLRGRLVTSTDRDGAQWVELAHESLIGGWDRLAGWLDESREARRWLERVDHAAHHWVEEGRPSALLWKGRPLKEVIRRCTDSGLPLGRESAEFVAAGRARRRRVRRWSWGAAVLALALVTTAVLVSLRGLELYGAKEREAAAASRAAWANGVVNAAASVEDPLLAALLLTELTGEPEPPGGAKLARTLAREALPIAVLRGHTHDIQGAEFSPDGKHLLTSSHDGTVRIWRSDGRGQPVVLKHKRFVGGAHYSPDGEWIATVSGKTVRLWPATGAAPPKVVGDHTGWIRDCAFDRRGERLLTWALDGTARLWPVAGKVASRVFGRRARVITGARFGRGDRWILTMSKKRGLRLWAAHDGTRPRLTLPSSGFRWAALSPRARFAAAWDRRDRIVRLWPISWRRTPTGEVPSSGPKPILLRGHRGVVSTAAFSPDGRYLVTGARDGEVRLWHLDRVGEVVSLPGHTNWVRGFSFSRDGSLLLTASVDKTARIWRIDGLPKPVVLKGHAASVSQGAFSPDGSLVATWSRDRTVRVWSTQGSREPLALGGHRGAIRGVAFSPDGTRLLTTSADHTARVWRSDGSGDPAILKGHTGTVYFASFSPDGRWVATPSRDGTVRIWRADGSGEPRVLRGHRGLVEVARFSPDGKQLVTASWDGTARLWNTRSWDDPTVLRHGKSANVLRLRGNDVRWAEFSPDGRHVVTASFDGTARVWPTDGREKPVILRHQAGVLYATFGPNGRRVATAVQKGAKIWRADGTGEPISFPARGDDTVWRVAFSPDGKRLAVSDHNTPTIRIYRSDGRGKPLLLRGHRSLVRTLAFSPDGSHLLSSTSDETTRVWPISALVTTGSSLRQATASPIVIPANGFHAAFSPDGKRVAVGSASGVTTIWRLWIRGWQSALRFLRGNTRACLTVAQRKRYLKEAAEVARQRHRKCEAP